MIKYLIINVVTKKCIKKICIKYLKLFIVTYKNMHNSVNLKNEGQYTIML